MKPLVVLTCTQSGQRLSLLRHQDGRWAVRKDGEVVGVWGADEERECHIAFCLMCEMDEAVGLAVISAAIRKLHPPTNDDPATN